MVDNDESKSLAELCLRGLECFNRGDFDGALVAYNKAVKKAPNSAEARVGRGTALNVRGEYDKAINDFEEAIRLNPDLAEAYAGRGSIWYAMSEYEKALEDCNKSLKLDPDRVEAWVNRGAVWEKKGKYDKAIDDYSEAIRRRPKHALAWNGRGSAWQEKGEHNKAINDYKEAVRLKPDFALAWRNLGVAQMDIGEHEEAMKSFDKATQLKNDFSEAMLSRNFTSALREIDAKGREFAEKLRAEHARQLEKAAKAAMDQLVMDTEHLRDIYEKKRLWSSVYTIASFFTLLGIGFLAWDRFDALVLTPDPELSEPIRLLYWGLITLATSSGLVLLWWMLQRKGFEEDTLSQEFLRKAIVEDRMHRYTISHPELQKEVLKDYFRSWMEKAPPELMMAIRKRNPRKSGDQANSFIEGTTKVINDLKSKISDPEQP